MSVWKSLTVCPIVCAALAACAPNTMPIIAGAVDQVGVGISGGAQDQGGNLTVGYRGAKFAVLPVTNANGEILALRDGQDKRRGFSVLAVLGVDAKGGVPTGVDIQQAVAVGPAAEIWALGRSGLTADEIARAKAAGLVR